jgi:hypothetical protein
VYLQVNLVQLEHYFASDIRSGRSAALEISATSIFRVHSVSTEDSTLPCKPRILFFGSSLTKSAVSK